MNLLAAFQENVAAHPERIALIDPKGCAWSYRALDQRGKVLAAAFREKGLGEGDRVLLAVGVDADLYASLAALWRIGAVAVLPEPALGLNGIRRAIELAQPQAVLLGGLYRILSLIVGEVRKIPLQLRLVGGQADAECEVATVPCDAPALISFTTGSTGKPKAIVRSHGFMRAQDKAVAPLIGTNGTHEIDLVGFPVFVIANLGQGITSVLPDWSARRQSTVDGARIARLIERHGITRLLLNPELVRRLAAHQVPASVHAIFTGGGPVFPDLIRILLADSRARTIVAVYGSTEAEPIAEISASEISDADYRAMAAGGGLLAGHPVAGIRVRIEDNEIQVAGDHVVQGYLDPARDSESKIRDNDGTLWHRTGDAGRVDATGRIWLLGRLKDRIGVLWPFAIETAARNWPGVSRAALMSKNGKAVLAIEGNTRHLREWRAHGEKIGPVSIQPIRKMPMDKRHGSKVDMMRLKPLIE